MPARSVLRLSSLVWQKSLYRDEKELRTLGGEDMGQASHVAYRVAGTIGKERTKRKGESGSDVL